MKTLDKIIAVALVIFTVGIVFNKALEVVVVKETIRHNLRLEELQNERDRNEIRLMKDRQSWIETLQEVEG